MDMKSNFYCKWAFAIIMAMVSCTSAFAETPITSHDRMSVGTPVEIYHYGEGGESSYAPASNGDGYALTSYSEADDGTWTSDDGITYHLNNDDMTAEVYSAPEEISGDIEIPKYVERDNERFPITSLANGCFQDCTNLTSITLPGGITSLGDGCFRGCSSLTSISLPEGITSLGDLCFYGCSSLTSISLPSGITSLGDGCFFGCSSLTSISLPEGITSLGSSCFCVCSSLTSISLPDGITSLGDYCFRGCSSLTSISLPSSITSLGDGCFDGCSNLTSISLPDGITSLGYCCFFGCSSLTSITLPSSITSLVSSCFDGCSSLTSITLPSGITSLGVCCFCDCRSLTSITLPSGITSLGTNCFTGCKKISFLALPSGLQTIESDVFLYAMQKKTIVCPCATPPECGSYFIDSNTSLFVPSNAIDKYKNTSPWNEAKSIQAIVLTLPDEVAVGRNEQLQLECVVNVAGYNPKGLGWTSSNEDVAIVDENGVVTGKTPGTALITVKAIDGSSATCKVTVFNINLSTKTINLQTGEKYVEQTVTVLPDNYEHKDVVWTASGNGVASVDKDGNITANKPGIDTLRCSLSCDSNIFAECRVIVYDENVVYVGGLYYILHDEDSSDLWATVTSIYGGKNTSLDASQVAQYYSGTISIPETIIYDGKKYIVRKVGSYAFNCQNDLQSIYVPRTVTEIESHAAIKAEKLNRVNVADGSQLVTIGEEAFKWCTGLKRFTFDGTSSLKTIKDYAFFRCSVLNNFVMPNTTLSVGNSAFRYNAGLTNIQLSTSLNYIDEYAFGECGFSTITLPESLANIQAGAFINNEHLQTITLPEQLQGLGSAAFENNSALQSVTFTSMETMTIGNNAFNQCPVLNKVYLTNMKSFAQTNFNNAKANPANTSQHIYDANGAEITKVVLPNGTKYVNNNAFNGCAYIVSIVMPSTMDHVNDDIFVGCSALQDVYCYATEVPDFIGVKDPSSMDDVFAQATLHVIYGNENAYRADSWWGRFNKIEGCDANGIGDISMEDVNVVINNRHITVEGLADDDAITIVNTLGITVYKGTSHEVDLNAAGVYIMKVRGTTFKVNVK